MVLRNVVVRLLYTVRILTTFINSTWTLTRLCLNRSLRSTPIYVWCWRWWVDDTYRKAPTKSSLESTVVTLADWYHGLATQIFPNPTHVPPYAHLPLETWIETHQTPYVDHSTRHSSMALVVILVVPPTRHWLSSALDPVRGIVTVSLAPAATLRESISKLVTCYLFWVLKTRSVLRSQSTATTWPLLKPMALRPGRLQ